MSAIDFDQLVDRHYEPLYRFALSLAKNSGEAADLTQQTFYLWAAKGHQLRETAKVKSWLFTTLYREYVGTYRHQTRFPHVELDDAADSIPSINPSIFNDIDGNTVVVALTQVDEVYRAPLVLFYLEELAYKEIAEVLAIPIGTVMSRLARGKAQLREILLEVRSNNDRKVIPLDPEARNRFSV
ncbi:MAG: RNA polymerase sigma factor [Chitinophagia bacterium]|nr:RNA polymerase sigma factor [Chitinophagia bacterium]